MMRKNPHLRRNLLTAGLVLLGICSAVQGRNQKVWGKRIWDHELDDHRRIVVDERGDDDTMRGLQYCWRLLAPDEEDGPVFLIRSGVRPLSGTGLLFDKIEVLDAKLIGKDLTTVFNQRNQCYAFVAHANADGTFTSEPDANFMRTDSNIGPPMKSASLKKNVDGFFESVATDKENRQWRFELRSAEKEPKRFNWVKVEGPTTVPTTTKSVIQH